MRNENVNKSMKRSYNILLDDIIYLQAISQTRRLFMHVQMIVMRSYFRIIFIAANSEFYTFSDEWYHRLLMSTRCKTWASGLNFDSGYALMQTYCMH